MKTILTLILALITSSTFASNEDVKIVKSCPSGLEIQHFDSWTSGDSQSHFFITVSGIALKSLSDQLGPRINTDDLQHFEVGSSSWGEFSGIAVGGNVFVHEINDGKNVFLTIQNSYDQKLAEYYFNDCK